MALNSSSDKAIAAAIRRGLSDVCSSNNGRPLRAEKNSRRNHNTIENEYLSTTAPLLTPLEETEAMTPAATMSRKEVAIQAYHRSLATLHKSVPVLDEVKSNHYQEEFKLKFPFKIMLSEKGVSNILQPLKSPLHLARHAGFIFEGRDLTEFPFTQPILAPSTSDLLLQARPNVTAPGSISNYAASPTQENRPTFQVRPPLSPQLTGNEIEIFRTLWKRQFPKAFCQPADAVNDWFSRQDEKIICFWKSRIWAEMAPKEEPKSEAGVAEVAAKRQKRRYTRESKRLTRVDL